MLIYWRVYLAYTLMYPYIALLHPYVNDVQNVMVDMDFQSMGIVSRIIAVVIGFCFLGIILFVIFSVVIFVICIRICAYALYLLLCATQRLIAHADKSR